MTRHSQQFQSKILFFKDIRAFIDHFCEAVKLSGADRHKLTLVVEELFTNTVRHGHGGDSDAPVDISLDVVGEKIRLTYQDTAPPYNSLAAAMRTDVESTINERRIGGLGMALTFALAETAQYTYVENKNRLVITLPQTTGQGG